MLSGALFENKPKIEYPWLVANITQANWPCLAFCDNIFL